MARHVAPASSRSDRATPKYRTLCRQCRAKAARELSSPTFAAAGTELLRLESASPMKKALDHLQKADVILGSIIARVGPCKMTYRDPSFEMLARAIVFQQLSTKAASTIYG